MIGLVVEAGRLGVPERADVAGHPARTVCHECHVMRRITSVIARPINGSAIGTPSATTAALATTARLT